MTLCTVMLIGGDFNLSLTVGDLIVFCFAGSVYHLESWFAENTKLILIPDLAVRVRG